MKNNEVKNHFLHVFQQKLTKLISIGYASEYLHVKHGKHSLPKSFSDVMLMTAKKKQVRDRSQTCF